MEMRDGGRMQRTQYRRDERLNSDQEKDVQSRDSSKKPHAE